MNSKCIKDLYVKPETMKSLEENRGNTSGHWNGNRFFDKTPKHRKQKQT
jgi:hypothetical protein